MLERGTRLVESGLVFTDNPQKRPSLGAIDFYDKPNESHSKKFVTNVRLAHDVKSGKVTLRDYDFRRPRLLIEDESKYPLLPGESPEEAYERALFLQGGSLVEVASAPDKLPVADDRSLARHDKKENLARAERWAQAERHQKRYVELDSSEPNLAPGVVMAIGAHPHPELAESKTLMIVESMLQGSTIDWTLSAIATFADTKQRYRPEVVTPKPRIQGLQTAVVVGPAGKQIHVDEHARVRVRMHWDREAPFDDSATCWLRVSQAWAGAGFGSVLHPRVGQEVIVDFFEGDPDQPLVVGRLHNSTTVVPRVLPKSKPMSVWRSASSPQSDGCFNEIMIDDTAGNELVFKQAERDLSKLVRKDETERTGKDRTVIVGAARVSGVAGLDSVQVGKQHLAKIVRAGDFKIAEMGQPDVTQKDTFFEMVDKKITLTTGQATILLDGPNIAVDAAHGLRFTADLQLVIKGSRVYFNCKPATKTKPKSNKKVLDPVNKPDRMIGTVDQLFWKKEQEKQLAAKDVKVSLPGSAPGGKPGSFEPKHFPSPNLAYSNVQRDRGLWGGDKGDIIGKFADWMAQTANDASQEAAQMGLAGMSPDERKAALEQIYQDLVQDRKIKANRDAKQPDDAPSKIDTPIKDGDPNFDPFGKIAAKANGGETPEYQERVDIGKLMQDRFDSTGTTGDVIQNKVTLADGSVVDGNKIHKGASADAINAKKGNKYGYDPADPKFITETTSPENQQKLHDDGIQRMSDLIGKKDQLTPEQAKEEYAKSLYSMFQGPVYNRGSDSVVRMFGGVAHEEVFGKPVALPQNVDIMAYAKTQDEFVSWLTKII